MPLSQSLIIANAPNYSQLQRHADVSLPGIYLCGCEWLSPPLVVHYLRFPDVTRRSGRTITRAVNRSVFTAAASRRGRTLMTKSHRKRVIKWPACQRVLPRHSCDKLESEVTQVRRYRGQYSGLHILPSSYWPKFGNSDPCIFCDKWQ